MIVFYDVQTSLCRTSARFLFGTKLGEGSYSASANEAKFVTVTDGVSERKITFIIIRLFRNAKEKINA